MAHARWLIVALAACGGKAAPSPAPVDNLVAAPPDAAPSPSLPACAAPVDLGEGAVACVERDGEDWTLSVRNGRETVWTETVTLIEQSEEDDPYGAEWMKGEVTAVDFALGPAERGARFDIVQEKGGNQYHDWTTRIVVVRVADGSPVLELQTSNSSGEADNLERVTITPLDSTTGGFYDLELHWERMSAQWAAGEEPEESEETEVWAWDGSGYAARL